MKNIWLLLVILAIILMPIGDCYAAFVVKRHGSNEQEKFNSSIQPVKSSEINNYTIFNSPSDDEVQYMARLARKKRRRIKFFWFVSLVFSILAWVSLISYKQRHSASTVD